MRPEFMREAISLAVENVRSGTGGPFGALVVKDGRVIGRGTNLVTATNDPSAHAEIVAIREACQTLGSFQLEGCEIYTSCEPCPMCLGAIYWARPAAIYYAADRHAAAAAGFDDALIYEELTRAMEARTFPFKRIETKDAQAPFEAWASSQGKVRY